MFDIAFQLEPTDRETIEVSHPGYITIAGDEGRACSREAGQPSMVLVDVVQILAGVRLLFTGDARGFRIMAQGSAFTMDFQRTGESKLAIAAQGELIVNAELAEILPVLHAAATNVWTDARVCLKPDDPAIADIDREMEAFAGFWAQSESAAGGDEGS